MRVIKKGIAMELAGLDWRKSSLSGPYSDNCVEVAGLDGPLVAVRDSTDPDGSVLAFTPEEWEAFVGGAKQGEFDQT